MLEEKVKHRLSIFLWRTLRHQVLQQHGDEDSFLVKKAYQGICPWIMEYQLHEFFFINRGSCRGSMLEIEEFIFTSKILTKVENDYGVIVGYRCKRKQYERILTLVWGATIRKAVQIWEDITKSKGEDVIRLKVVAFLKGRIECRVMLRNYMKDILGFKEVKGYFERKCCV